MILWTTLAWVSSMRVMLWAVRFGAAPHPVGLHPGLTIFGYNPGIRIDAHPKTGVAIVTHVSGLEMAEHLLGLSIVVPNSGLEVDS